MVLPLVALVLLEMQLFLHRLRVRARRRLEDQCSIPYIYDQHSYLPGDNQLSMALDNWDHCESITVPTDDHR